MIDHLLNFTDEPTAQADPVVGNYWIPPDSDGNPGSWRGDVAIPNVEVYTLAEDGVTHQDLPGWFIIISLLARDQNLETEGGCLLIADRELANAGNPGFLLYTASNVTEAVLQSTYVEPTFAGSNYPFGAGAP